MTRTIEIIRGDITTQKVDAIVNAANTTLLGGGGVDGAIHRAAGPELLQECKTINGCPTGEARITGGYQLPAKYVIHTVGPVWVDGNKSESKLLASCYQNALELAANHQCSSIAFPAISCGIYGYPLPEAARVSLSTVRECMQLQHSPKLIRWVMFDSIAYKIWSQTYHAIFLS